MEYSDLDAFRLAAILPEGVTPGSDMSVLATGICLGVDAARRLIQVKVGASEGIWVPADLGIYAKGARVRLIRSQLDGGRVVKAEGTLDDVPEIVAGIVKTINTAAGTLTVTTMDSNFDLPYNAGTYAVGTPVHVLRSAQKLGMPFFVLGPQGNYAGANPGDPGGGAPNPGQLVQRQAVILPQGSGSWRASQGRWNSWDSSAATGMSTLWQGDNYGSGPMTGLAWYGDQIVNLGAQVIDGIRVTVFRADSSVSSAKAPTLQPAPHGSRPGGAPTPSGTTVTGSGLTPGAGAQIDLPAGVLDGFRTGASKSLATVGADYAGFSGTSKGDGMAMTVLYKVLA